MKLYARSGRCPLCAQQVDPDEHFHTLTQVTWWIWDSQHRAYRATIIIVAVILVVFLAAIISPITHLIRESL